MEELGGVEADAPRSDNGAFGSKLRLGILAVVLALAVAYLGYVAFPGGTVYYLTVDEFLDEEPSTEARSVRVIGTLVPDTFLRVPDTVTANFVLENGGKTLPATYEGVLPDLFFNPHSDIVLEGRMGDGEVFQTHTVIVKCPSKYQALSEEA